VIKSKVTGSIDFGGGPIEVQGETETVSLPIDSEDIRRVQQTIVLFEPSAPAWADEIRDTVDRVLMGGYKPTGPIVDSTLAEKSEERQ
jgi:hypothetical protein